MNSFRSVLAVVVLLFAVSLARAEEFDVSPAVSGNQIVTNAFQDALEIEVPNVRVFAYEFGEVPGQPFFLPDPGFHPLQGSGFAQGSRIGFAALGGMTFWDGTGSPSFGALPGGETLTLGFGSNSMTIGSIAPVPAGFFLGAVDENGEFDDHLDSLLTRGGGLDPTVGIYLLSMEVITDAQAVSPSLPIYILYNNGLDEELLDDARLFARDTFAPGSNLPEIPEPQTAAIAGFGWMLTSIFCRRRRP